MRNIKTYRKDFTAEEREAYKAYRRENYRNESKEKREARKLRASKINNKRNDGYYSVYYIPNEHYVGYTKMFDHRMKEHSRKGKNVEGTVVLRTFEDKNYARLYEAQWHTMGVNGSDGW